MSEAKFTIVEAPISIQDLNDREDGKPRSFTMVEEYGELTLDNGRKVNVSRWINGMGFELRYAKDDPKHPGGRFSFAIRPVIDAVMAHLETS